MPVFPGECGEGDRHIQLIPRHQHQSQMRFQDYFL